VREQTGQAKAIPFLPPEHEGPIERFVAKDVEAALHGVRIVVFKRADTAYRLMGREDAQRKALGECIRQRFGLPFEMLGYREVIEF
jgi:hypothetical protein